MILTYRCDDCEEEFKTSDRTVVIEGAGTVCKPCYDDRSPWGGGELKGGEESAERNP